MNYFILGIECFILAVFYKSLDKLVFFKFENKFKKLSYFFYVFFLFSFLLTLINYNIYGF